MTPPAHIELAAGVVNLYIDDASEKLRLPTRGEQFAIDVVAAWTNGRPRSPQVIPFMRGDVAH